MMNILFWVANIIIIYALLVVIVTAIRKPTDIRYTFLNLFRQRRRSGVTLLAITLGGWRSLSLAGLSITRSGRCENKPSAPTWGIFNFISKATSAVEPTIRCSTPSIITMR